MQSLRGGGQPLSASARAFFEPRLGRDLGHVRVHADAGADEAARAVRARAFTVGRDVVFGAGQYAPGTVEGRRLLAHELAHVVQQSTGATQTGPALRRQASEEVPAGAPSPAETAVAAGPASVLIVEDTTAEVGPGQMKKSAFLAELRAAVCRAAEPALARVGRTTADCPYVAYYFGYYAARDAGHVESAIRRYLPEASQATSAWEIITRIAGRVAQAVEVWVTTGRITGIPEGVPAGQQEPGSAESASSEAVGVHLKARDGGPGEAGDPRAIRAQLGPGRSLEGGVRSRMERAFGRSFAQVRAHTDARAAGLAAGLNARAFAVGRHVAFGAGEYRPGTPIGDALVAHELAHVVQQGGPEESASAAYGRQAATRPLESDADLSAVSAVASLWSGVRGAFSGIARGALPRLKSGLRLSRCKKCPTNKIISMPLHVFELTGRSIRPADAVRGASKIWEDEAGIRFVPKYYPRYGEGRTRYFVGTEPGEDRKPVHELVLAYTTIPSGTTEMDRLRAEKLSKAGKALGAIFVPRVGIFPSAADPLASYRLVYIGTYKCSPGYTLAHEIGHVLLGGGHKVWDSALMHPNNCSHGISDLECRMARGDWEAWKEYYRRRKARRGGR